jgi:hypothetical protein
MRRNTTLTRHILFHDDGHGEINTGNSSFRNYVELVFLFSALQNGMTTLQNRVGNNLAWQCKDYMACRAKTSVFRNSPER